MNQTYVAIKRQFIKIAKREMKIARKKAAKIAASVEYDVKAIRDRDPAAKSDLEVLLLYSGMHALLAHRVAHHLHNKKCYLGARAVSQASRFITGIFRYLYVIISV